MPPRDLRKYCKSTLTDFIAACNIKSLFLQNNANLSHVKTQYEVCYVV